METMEKPEEYTTYADATSMFSKVRCNDALNMINRLSEDIHQTEENRPTTRGAFEMDFEKWIYLSFLSISSTNLNDWYVPGMTVEDVLEKFREFYENDTYYNKNVEYFQKYITDCSDSDVQFLNRRYGLDFAYSEDLGGLWVLLVPHVGTSWGAVDWRQATIEDEDGNLDIYCDYIESVKQEIAEFLKEKSNEQ